MTLPDDSTTLKAKLIAADDRMQRANKAYRRRFDRDAGPDNDWPESAEVDAAGDDRLDIEDEALASGDSTLVDFVRRRRQRDNEFFPLTLIVTSQAA
jgi:hypothetical protein